jgi:hypothetical protein
MCSLATSTKETLQTDMILAATMFAGMPSKGCLHKGLP